ncbi:uncharacterized protein LOC141976901 isoform X3 [Natator depressus]|uniref:uncharacterized protein LOC141976901 isoform X3 n=1 Tax=Natator depressus TaxID=27790 RepID=UPI003EB71DC8
MPHGVGAEGPSPCPARREAPAEGMGQTCQRTCTQDRDCSGRRQCLCDGACGLSCVIPGRTCPWPVQIDNAKIRLAQASRGFGALMEVTCQPGFRMSKGQGAALSRCQGDRKWSLMAPCERDLTPSSFCSPPPETDNGFHSGASYRAGGEVRYKCKRGALHGAGPAEPCALPGPQALDPGDPRTAGPARGDRHLLLPEPEPDPELQLPGPLTLLRRPAAPACLLRRAHLAAVQTVPQAGGVRDPPLLSPPGPPHPHTACPDGPPMWRGGASGQQGTRWTMLPSWEEQSCESSSCEGPRLQRLLVQRSSCVRSPSGEGPIVQRRSPCAKAPSCTDCDAKAPV